jgi:hypothetical protein
MRSLNDHKVNGLNEKIEIAVIDDPDRGGGNHHYQIVVMTPTGPITNSVRFQKGPIAEAGVNGLSNEALLAIVIDRLRGFQSGEFKCEENAQALAGLEGSLSILKKRTTDRVTRGVEGTYKE